MLTRRFLRTSRLRWPSRHNQQRRAFFWSSQPSSSSSSSSFAASTSSAHSSGSQSTSIPSIAPDLTTPVLGSLLHAQDSLSDEEDVTPPWTVTPLKGKGFGAIAWRDISIGERLIAERPLCIWPQGLDTVSAKSLFDAMTEEQKKVYGKLAMNESTGGEVGLDEVRNRRATNGFVLELPGTGGKRVGMVFPNVARVNHSCTPNASQSMNYQTLKMEIYSITSIPQGQEITIEYLPSLILLPYSERQSALKEAFGFETCLCPTCSLPLAERAKSDDRRKEIRKLGKAISASSTGGRKEKLGMLDKVRTLLEEENYVSLPEFDDESVSNAFAVYMSMYRRGAIPQG